MSLMDRDLQRRILEYLAEKYPFTDFPDFLGDIFSELPSDEEIERYHKVAFNINYLQEHGLISGGMIIGVDNRPSFYDMKITKTGLDFLEDDGGLSAILGTVTVKLHSDTIKEVIQSKIENSQLPPEKKSRIKFLISTLSGEALKTVTQSLVKDGINSIPDLLTWVKVTFPNAHIP
jgi:hypothetical protein